MTAPDHAAALAMLDRITPGPWRPRDRNIGWDVVRTHNGDDNYEINDGFRETFEEFDARAIAALPELAALYRAGVELQHHLRKSLDAGPYTNNPTRESQRFREFHAALAAVADKLGEGK